MSDESSELEKKLKTTRLALIAIASALDVPRNRFGRLDASSSFHVLKQESLRFLAIHYQVGGCEDVAEQVRKVALAVLDETAEEVTS